MSRAELISLQPIFCFSVWEVGYVSACVCMLAACPCLPTRGVSICGSSPWLFKATRDRTDPEDSTHLSVSLASPVPLLRCSLVFPIPATACTAVRESRPPKPRPLRSYTGRRAIRFLGSVSARLLALSDCVLYIAGLLPRRLRRPRHHHGRHQRRPWWRCCSDLPGRDVRASHLLLCTITCVIFRSARCA